MIKINELELQEVSCLHEGSTLLLSFEMEDMTLQELEDYFSLNENTVIEQYENEMLINKWYYKEFQSIGYEKAENGWKIQLSLEVTHFSQGDLKDIHDLIEEKEKSLTQLSLSVNQIQTQLDEFSSTINSFQLEVSSKNNFFSNKIASLQTILSNLESNYIRLADRVANLENNVNNIKTTTNNTTIDNNNTNSDNNDSNIENTDTNVEDYDASDNIEDDELLEQ